MPLHSHPAGQVLCLMDKGAGRVQRNPGFTGYFKLLLIVYVRSCVHHESLIMGLQ